jgi:hypothetical protein
VKHGCWYLGIDNQHRYLVVSIQVSEQEPPIQYLQRSLQIAELLESHCEKYQTENNEVAN